jgi:hypothetical protein
VAGTPKDIPAAGTRKDIPAATQAALWALSNGRCYFPSCPFPVVVEVRPGVYRKNAQIAHIYGVRPGASRHESDLDDPDRDSFRNLLLLCTAHHSEVDDKKTGGTRYPPHVLLEWKAAHEGANGPWLARLGSVTEEALTEFLVDAFTPPLKRLQQIADQLASTGTLNARAIAELQQMVTVMSDNPAGPSSQTAAMLLEASDLYSSLDLANTATALSSAAEQLDASGSALSDQISQMSNLLDQINHAPRNHGYGEEGY